MLTGPRCLTARNTPACERSSPSAAALGPEKLDAALPVAEQHAWIYASVGVHPHEARLAREAHFEQLDSPLR